MKTVLTLTAIMLAATLSQAKTVCNLNSGDPQKDMVFDHVLFSGEITSPKILLVSKDNSSASEVQLSQFTSFEKWKAIDGRTLVTFSQQNGSYGITVGQIDTSKGDTNALPLNAMAIGPVTQQSPLNLVVPPKNLSAICVQLN